MVKTFPTQATIVRELKASRDALINAYLSEIHSRLRDAVDLRHDRCTYGLSDLDAAQRIRLVAVIRKAGWDVKLNASKSDVVITLATKVKK